MTILEGEKHVDEGAVRVAAIDRKQFEVTNFLSVSQIDAQPDSVAAVFPAALCDAIKQRAATSH